MLDELVKFVMVLLVVVEPLSLLPILAGLTDGSDDAYRRRMSFKAVAVSAAVCVLFAVGGTAALKLLGISVDAFKIGGGILLFILAIEMVFARESGVRSITQVEGEEANHRVDISVFPLAFPQDPAPSRHPARSRWHQALRKARSQTPCPSFCPRVSKWVCRRHCGRVTHSRGPASLRSRGSASQTSSICSA